MNENDLIAEYVKERFPEILQTMDFAVFKLSARCRKVAYDFIESFKKVDFTKLQLMINDLNKRNENNTEEKQ